MKCFWQHHWVVKAVYYMTELPMSVVKIGIPPKQGKPLTTILYVCSECGESKTVDRDGKWNIEQLSK